ncbi:MAG TPA: dihydropteroate synthase [Dehalococcoidia bacterium]|nr:dihydropteroate synthase [Dehalococcoidia bacterium]
MLVIGEKINASNKSVGEAISNKNQEFLENLTREQDAAGADFIDVNAGVGHGTWENPAMAMEWLVDIVQSVTEKPLAIDSDTPSIIEAGLRKYRGDNVMINSVNAEPDRLEPVGRLAAERRASLVALVMGEGGIPPTVDERLDAAESIMVHLTRLGMQEEQIFFDPLVLPVSVDSNQGFVTLKTIEGIKSRYPSAKTVVGLSNISYGLPNRGLVNRAFLVMAASAGLDAAILNPLDARMMSFIRVADMLTGNDPSCKGFIRAHRKGLLVE